MSFVKYPLEHSPLLANFGSLSIDVVKSFSDKSSCRYSPWYKPFSSLKVKKVEKTYSQHITLKDKITVVSNLMVPQFICLEAIREVFIHVRKTTGQKKSEFTIMAFTISSFKRKFLKAESLFNFKILLHKSKISKILKQI